MVTLDQTIGSYRVVRKIGAGGMGEVYEAVNENIQRRVAIKVLRPQYSRSEQFARRFFNEARVANIIDHPGVVEVFDFGEMPDGAAYIVMEFLKGDSLSARLEKAGGRLTLGEALLLTEQVAGALAAAHDKGIVHRDLKPDNVMMVPEPAVPGGVRPKILDFGIAKVAAEHRGEGPEAEKLTQTGMMMGTALYMAPEQCGGAGGVDGKADVYSLGVIFFQVLAGRPPFLAEGVGQVMAMHIYERPPALRDLDPSLPEECAALVERMLAKAPASRPTMAEVVDATAYLARSASRVSDRAPLPPTVLVPATLRPSTLGQATGQAAPPAPRPPSSPAGAIVGGVISCALVLGIGFALLQRGAGGRAVASAASAAASAPAIVRWQISSSPPGAQVLRSSDGAQLGTSPYYAEQEVRSGVVQLTLRKAGFADKIILLDQGKDERRAETLSVLPAPEAPIAARPPARSKVQPRKAKAKGITNDDIPLPDL